MNGKINNVLSDNRREFPLQDHHDELQQQQQGLQQGETVISFGESSFGDDMDMFITPDNQPQVYHTATTLPPTFVQEQEDVIMEKISDLEKSNSFLHNKVDDLTSEVREFRNDFAAFLLEFNKTNKSAMKSVTFSMDSRKRPSSTSDVEEQPVAKKPTTTTTTTNDDENTVAFSQKFVKGKPPPTTKKEKDVNIILDFILVLVWASKLGNLFCSIFGLKNISKIDDEGPRDESLPSISIAAYSFARWMKSLREELSNREKRYVAFLADNISSADLQKLKTGAAFHADEKVQQLMKDEAEKAKGSDKEKDRVEVSFKEFKNRKSVKMAYVSTMLSLFSKHGTTIVNVFHAMKEKEKKEEKISSEHRDVIFSKLYSTFSAFNAISELGNLACICTACKTRVVDVFCVSCKCMTACSVCFEKSGNLDCVFCKIKMKNVTHGYNSSTSVSVGGGKSTSALYSSSVRTIPRIQTATKYFCEKHWKTGLIGHCSSNGGPSLKANENKAVKAFLTFVTSTETVLMKTLDAIETFLKQGKNSLGIRLCDVCRGTAATKKLRFEPKDNTGEKTLIAVCNGCFEDKQQGPSFIRCSKDFLYKGVNMSLTSAVTPINLLQLPLDSRHRRFLKKDNKQSNMETVCKKYGIDTDSKPQMEAFLLMKTVLKQINSWGVKPEHNSKTYFEHVSDKMSLCWPVNANPPNLTEVYVDEKKQVQTRRGADVNLDSFFAEQRIQRVISPLEHEANLEEPHPFVKKIVQVFKDGDNKNDKNVGLKAVLKESEVFVYQQSIIVIGKVFKRLETSQLLSDLDTEDEPPIIGFYNEKFYPHPDTLKKEEKKKNKKKTTTKKKKTKKTTTKKKKTEAPPTTANKDLALSEDSSSSSEEEKDEESEEEEDNAASAEDEQPTVDHHEEDQSAADYIT